MKKFVGLLTTIVIFAPSIAFADPVPKNVFDVSWNLVPIFLFESLIIFMLLGWSNFDIPRFAVIWLVITLLTYITLGLWLGLCYVLFHELIVSTIVGETLVIIIEAFMLQKVMLMNDITVRKKMPIGMVRALLVSLIANIGSVVAGFIIRGTGINERAILQFFF